MMDSPFLRLRKGSAESFLWRGVGLVALFAMHALLGRRLAPAYYGVFSFALSIATVLSFFSTMGWPAALVRLIPEYRVKAHWGLLKGLLWRSHQLTLALSVLFSALLLGLASALGEGSRADACRYAAVLLPLLSLIALRRRIFQGFHVARGSIIPDEVALPALVALFLFIAHRVSVGHVILAYTAIAIAVLALTVVWLWRVFPVALKHADPAFDLRAWTRLALPLMLGGLFQIMLSQSGTFFLGFFNRLHDTGLFGAAFRLSLFVTFAMTAVNVIGMPMLATAFHDDDTALLRQVFRKTWIWSFAGALPVFALLILFPGSLLSLFGANFEQGAGMLRILAIGQLVNAAVGLSGSLLVVAGKERLFAASTFVCALVCIVGMIVFIPRDGGVGAASIYSACLAALSVFQLYAAKRAIAV